jgi:hypothetical protein
MKKFLYAIVAMFAAVALSISGAAVANAAPKPKPKAPVSQVTTVVKSVSVAYVNGGAADTTNTFTVKNNTGASLEVHYNYYLKWQTVIGATGNTVIPAGGTVVFEYARYSGAALQVIPVVNGLPDFLNRAQAYAL